MEVVPSRKGKDNIAYEGYLYRLDKTHLETLSWRCTKTACKGRLTTPWNFREAVNGVRRGEHSHPPDPVLIQIRKTEGEVRRLATETDNPPRRIVQDVLGTASQEVAQRVGSAINMREVVRRKRRRLEEEDEDEEADEENRPRLPPALRQSLRGELFLQVDEEDVKIFATTPMLNVLSNSTHWLADGTFKLAPQAFLQIYTVHAIVREHALPVVYALLKNKSRAAYTNVWDHLKALVNLRPESVMIDFEAASKRSIEDNFPNATVAGCMFHLGQAIWRKVVDEGLREDYINQEVTRRFVKNLLALAFLRVDSVAEGFEILREHDEFPQSLEGLYDYFEDTYIGRHQRRGRRQPLFPLVMWNQRMRTEQGLPRTNNMAEGWHNAFQSSVSFSHPTLTKFARILQRENALQETNLIQINQGREIKTRLKKYEAVNRRLRRLIADPPQSTMEFLSAISANLEINVN